MRIFTGLTCPSCLTYDNPIDPIFNSTLSFNRNKEILIICNCCGWIGKVNQLLKKGEAISIKRTKLIDKILNESFM